MKRRNFSGYGKIPVLTAIIMIAGFSAVRVSKAQDPAANYQWKTPVEFDIQAGLQDPFLKPDGSRVRSRKEWPEQREYIKAMLAHYQYGTMPPVPEDVAVAEILSEEIYDGRAIRKAYKMTVRRNGQSVELHFGIVKPQGQGPFPLIIKIGYGPPDPLNKEMERPLIPEEALLEALRRGYIYCSFNRLDLGSDITFELDENRAGGIFPLYPGYSWGTIAAWAWGYKLLIDYFEKQPFVDSGKIVAAGQSRGGKTAMCAGIYDDRIAVTVANCSGLGGSTSHLYYELNNEPQQHIGDHIIRRPYWWTAAYYKLAGFESRAPFDAHFAKIAIAPRAFLSVDAYQDHWANPFGTYLTHAAAKKVYRWLDAEDHIGMFLRAGKHGHHLIDWMAMLDFCDQYFYDKVPESKFNILFDFNEGNPYSWAKIPLRWNVPGK